MDESTYAEADGSDGVDDDHPISWCQRYDGGRSWYTGLGHTDASFLEPAFLQHLLGGLEVATGYKADPTCGVVETNTPGDIAGNVPATLALTIGAPASFGTFVPAVARDYESSLVANVVSTASAVHAERPRPELHRHREARQRARALASPLQIKATNRAVTNAAFAPLRSDRSPLRLLSYTGPVSNDPVTIGFRQSIAATEPLLHGRLRQDAGVHPLHQHAVAQRCRGGGTAPPRQTFPPRVRAAWCRPDSFRSGHVPFPRAWIRLAFRWVAEELVG